MNQITKQKQKRTYPHTHALVRPVDFGSETINEVTVTRKLKHLRGCVVKAGADSKGGFSLDLDYATLIDLAAKMIGHPPSVLEDFDEEDQSEILGEANDFLLKHLGGGKAQ